MQRKQFSAKYYYSKTAYFFRTFETCCRADFYRFLSGIACAGIIIVIIPPASAARHYSGRLSRGWILSTAPFARASRAQAAQRSCPVMHQVFILSFVTA